MSYANEAEFRAAVVAYRALHEVFYRFHKSVRAQAAAGAASATPDLLASNERDYGAMTRDLLPAVGRTFGGPAQFVERLGETLRRLGAHHATSRQTPFDVHLAHQAYIDVDNILEDLLRDRARYPRVFDLAFSGIEDDEERALMRRPPPQS